MKYKWNIEFENMCLIYPNGKEALKNINLKINEGEFIAIIGLSGAGKTTLLKTINKLSDISSGNIYVGDKTKEAISSYEEKKKAFLLDKENYKSVLQSKEVSKEKIKLFLDKIRSKIKFYTEENKRLEKNIKKSNLKINEMEIFCIKEIKKESATKTLLKPYYIQINDQKINIKKFQNRLLKNRMEIHILKSRYDFVKNSSEESVKNSKEVFNIYIKTLEDELNSKKETFNKNNRKPFYIVNNLKGREARKYKSNIGMVFQRYNLIYSSSVLTNVLSGRLSKMSFWRAFTGAWSKKDKEIAFNALADVNMLENTYVRAKDLSGGQMQRVAIARTITQGARLFLADEPVGALDPIMAKSVMDSFLQINQKTGKTVLINLHHVDLALTYVDRIIGVKDGKIVFDGPAEKIDLKILKKIYGNKLEGFDAHELKEIMRKRKMVKG